MQLIHDLDSCCCWVSMSLELQHWDSDYNLCTSSSYFVTNDSSYILLYRKYCWNDALAFQVWPSVCRNIHRQSKVFVVVYLWVWNYNIEILTCARGRAPTQTHTHTHKRAHTQTELGQSTWPPQPILARSMTRSMYPAQSAVWLSWIRGGEKAPVCSASGPLKFAFDMHPGCRLCANFYCYKGLAKGKSSKIDPHYAIGCPLL